MRPRSGRERSSACRQRASPGAVRLVPRSAQPAGGATAGTANQHRGSPPSSPPLVWALPPEVWPCWVPGRESGAHSIPFCAPSRKALLHHVHEQSCGDLSFRGGFAVIAAWLSMDCRGKPPTPPPILRPLDVIAPCKVQQAVQIQKPAAPPDFLWNPDASLSSNPDWLL